MPSWNRDEVLRKVRALLCLAEGNANEAEAAAAADKARQLLQEYDLSLSEVELREEASGIVEGLTESLGRFHAWTWLLAQAVAETTSTRHFRNTQRRGRLVLSQRMAFVGTPADSAAAVALFAHLRTTVQVLAAGQEGLRARNSFALGCALRLRVRLAAMRRSAQPSAACRAIVQLKDQAIDQYLSRGCEVRMLRGRDVEVDDDAFAAGVDAAEAVGLGMPGRELVEERRA